MANTAPVTHYQGDNKKKKKVSLKKAFKKKSTKRYTSTLVGDPL